MHDAAHVGLVDAHAEGDGGDHPVGVAGEERLSRCLTLVLGQAAVVGGAGHAAVVEHAREAIGVLMRRDVHETRPAVGGDVAGGGLPLAVLVVEAPDLEADVGAIEVADDLDGVAQAQAAADLGAYGRRRRGGQREPPVHAEAVGDRAECEEVRPEALTPLADEMRLIDDQQVRSPRGQPVEHPRVTELLRRQEHERIGPGGGVQRGTPLARRFGGVELHRPQPGAGEVVDLILLEGEQR